MLDAAIRKFRACSQKPNPDCVNPQIRSPHFDPFDVLINSWASSTNQLWGSIAAWKFSLFGDLQCWRWRWRLQTICSPSTPLWLWGVVTRSAFQMAPSGPFCSVSCCQVALYSCRVPLLLSWSILSSFLPPSCPAQLQSAIVDVMVHSVQFPDAKLPCPAAECHTISQMKQFPTFSSSSSPSSPRHVWVFWAFLTSLY